MGLCTGVGVTAAASVRAGLFGSASGGLCEQSAANPTPCGPTGIQQMGNVVERGEKVFSGASLRVSYLQITWGDLGWI